MPGDLTVRLWQMIATWSRISKRHQCGGYTEMRSATSLTVKVNTGSTFVYVVKVNIRIILPIVGISRHISNHSWNNLILCIDNLGQNLSTKPGISAPQQQVLWSIQSIACRFVVVVCGMKIMALK